MILADFRLPRRLRPALTALVRVICPDDLDRLGLADEVTDTVEQCLRAYPKAVRHGLVAGLVALEAECLLRRRKPFSRLPREDAQAVFADWWTSRIGPKTAFVHAVKSVCALAYYDNRTVKDQIGYRPEPWIAERIRSRLEKYGLAVERAEADVLLPDPLRTLGRSHG